MIWKTTTVEASLIIFIFLIFFVPYCIPYHCTIYLVTVSHKINVSEISVQIQLLIIRHTIGSHVMPKSKNPLDFEN